MKLLLFSLIFLGSGFAADTPPPKPDAETVYHIQALEADQRANDAQIQSMRDRIILMSKAIPELQADSAKKKREEQSLSEAAFKKAGLSEKDYDLDVQKMEFVKKPPPPPVPKEK